MKASDLRIGNWVYNGKDIQVNAKKIYIYDEGLCDLLPIQITEQWLKEFGAEFWDFKIEKFGSWEKGAKLIIPSEWGSEMAIMLEPKSDKIKYDGKEWFGYMKCGGLRALRTQFEIQYVHQLQNLYYALTGEELIRNANTKEE